MGMLEKAKEHKRSKEESKEPTPSTTKADSKEPSRKHPHAKEPTPETTRAASSTPSRKQPAAKEPNPRSEAKEAEAADQSQADPDAQNAGTDGPQDSDEGTADSGAPESDDSADSSGAADDETTPQTPQGGAQATPVPNPAAPGAGDTTSGGDDTDTQDQATGGGPDEQDTGEAGSPADDTGGGPAASKSLMQVPMSPALQEELQSLNQRLYKELYSNDAVAQHVLAQLFPQGPVKIKGAVNASVILMREIFMQQKAPQQLVLPFTKEVVAHVLELGEQVKQIQYSDQEATAIFGSAYECALRMFGVKQSQFRTIQNLVPRSQLAQHHANYLAAHKQAQTAINANKAMPHPGGKEEAAMQSGGAAGPQGPQGAAPAAGAPPAAAGGMLSQAAAQQPQGQ